MRNKVESVTKVVSFTQYQALRVYAANSISDLLDQLASQSLELIATRQQLSEKIELLDAIIEKHGIRIHDKDSPVPDIAKPNGKGSIDGSQSSDSPPSNDRPS